MQVQYDIQIHQKIYQVWGTIWKEVDNLEKKTNIDKYHMRKCVGWVKRIPTIAMRSSKRLNSTT